MGASPEVLLQRRWVRWALYFGFWTGLGLFNTGQSYLHHVLRDRPFSFFDTLIVGLSDWYLWAAVTPVIIYLVRRFPLHQKNWLPNLGLHLVVNTVIAVVITLAVTPVFLSLREGNEPLSPFWVFFQFQLISYAVLYIWVYWSIVVVVHALDYYRKFRERERRAAQLETRLAQAQLQVLKMQLHPHFLFNTLNAISALMQKDVELADRMVARLGELLRTTLENAGTQEVPLGQELDFIRPYLEIEQARFGSRLIVQMDIEPETLDALVPNLVLQPLVENAILHGVAPFSEVGRIEIRARREEDELRLEVADNGPGLSPEQQKDFRPGVGVANTRARLQQLYGADHNFTMANGTKGGFTVTMILPFREHNEDVTREAASDPHEALAH